MFTGLIRETAFASVHDNKITVTTQYVPNVGDSISINGVCLTVIKLEEKGFTVEVSQESRTIIHLDNYNGVVNIEPAMKLSDRLEGHILQGHVDTTAVISDIMIKEDSIDFIIDINSDFIKYIVPKGSIAIDGVSLTINEVYKNSFRLTIINHTLNNSIINNYRVGRVVNVETDMFARYIHHMLNGKDNISQNELDFITGMY